MQAVTHAIEAIGLKLVLLGRLDRGILAPLFEQLAHAAASHGWNAELDSLAGLLATSEIDPEKKYGAFTQLLEQLRARTLAGEMHLHSAAGTASDRREAQAQPDTAGLIVYDRSNSVDIMNHFFLEVAAHLQTVEQAILHLEIHPEAQASLTSAFGALHSLKGVTGFLDLGVLRDLVHDAEAIIESARRHKTGATRPECDLLLRTVDLARAILERIRKHSEKPDQAFPALPENYAGVRAELAGAAAAGNSAALPSPQVATSGTQLPDGSRMRAPVAAASLEFAAPAPSAGAAPAPISATVAPTGSLAGEPTAGETRVLRQDRQDRQDRHERRETDSAVTAAALVRVQVEKLDRLIDAIGELAITQIQIFQHPTVQAVQAQQNEVLTRNIALAGKITRELQTLAMTLRMVPLKETFGRMTRLARDLAHRQHKDLAVEIEGEDTEMDKSLIELLVDPLTHLIRNAVDHGVAAPADRVKAGKPARATLRLSAWSQGGHVMVEVHDDGAGLQFDRILQKARQRGWVREGEQPEAIRLQQFIFEPGFSTAERVTDVSGRGIGLDVVRTKAASVGGRVVVRSSPEEGTTFTITLPLTLAIIDGLLVQSGTEQFILPLTLVVESLRPTRDQLGSVYERGEILEVRGQAFPLFRLGEYAGIRGAKSDPCESIVVIVDCRGEQFALQMDEILGVQQVVIKGLGDRLRGMKGVSGGAILGDGRVRLILDVAGILATSRQMRNAQVG